MMNSILELYLILAMIAELHLANFGDINTELYSALTILILGLVVFNSSDDS